MSPQYLIAIDQGTTSSRTILFDPNGKIIKTSRRKLKCYLPQAGYVEQNPKEILNSVFDTLTEILESYPAEQIISCGITNQRETIILWDKDSGEAIYNAIIWQDRRTDSWVTKHQAKYGSLIQNKTGLLLDAYFSASKIKWVLENIPKAKSLLGQKKLLCGTVDSFILWHLTKGKIHATDSSNASRTLLYNIHTKDYDDELLKIFSIPKEILPKVRNSIDNFGIIDKSISTHPIPISAILGDQQAATVGQACLTPAMSKITFGTGCFMMLNTGSEAIKSKSNLLTTILYSIDNKVTYGLEGSCFYAGSLINWLRDNLGIIDDVNKTEELLKQAKDIPGLYFVPAFGGLGAPHWNPNAKGLIKGITNQVGKNEIIKAAYDSIALQALDLIQAMENDNNHFSAIRIDGGMVNNQWFITRLATILNKTIDIPHNIESTAFGVALFSAIGVGKLNFSDIAKLYKIKSQEQPQQLPQYKELISGWKTATIQA